jgi:hypothetical protein
MTTTKTSKTLFAQKSASAPQMRSELHSSVLPSTLLLSVGLFLGLATLSPIAEARIASNSTSLNSANLQFDLVSTAQLQLEGSQLVLHLNH